MTFDIGSVYPNGRPCAYLKQDIATGLDIGGNVHIMGTCRMFGDVVYDGSCRGCHGYRGWRG